MSEEIRQFAEELIEELKKHRDFCVRSKTPLQQGYAMAHDHIIQLIKAKVENDE